MKTIYDIVDETVEKGKLQKLRGFDRISSVGKQYLADTIAKYIEATINKVNEQS